MVYPTDEGMGADERLQCTQGLFGLNVDIYEALYINYPKGEDLILTGLISETTGSISSSRARRFLRANFLPF